MPYIQLGFDNNRTSIVSSNYVIPHNLSGRYIVRIIGIHCWGNGTATPEQNNWVCRYYYIWSNQFYLSNEITNGTGQTLGTVSFPYIRVSNSDDNLIYYSPITTIMEFNSQPLLMRPISLYNATSFPVLGCVFTCEVLSLDKIELTKEPIELPFFCRLGLTQGNALTSNSQTVYRIPVNANGRYRGRFIGYSMMFGIFTVTASQANQNNLIQVYSNALNNFGANDGADGGLVLNMRNYRSDHHKRRSYPYFVTNYINGTVDIRLSCKLDDTSLGEITYFDLFLELLPIADRL